MDKLIAIHHLKDHKELCFLRIGNHHAKCKNRVLKNLFKEFDVAIECIEKQIPYEIEEKRWGDTYCKCGHKFSVHHGDGYHSVPYVNKTNFCPDCGQALNWKLEE